MTKSAISVLCDELKYQPVVYHSLESQFSVSNDCKIVKAKFGY